MNNNNKSVKINQWHISTYKTHITASNILENLEENIILKHLK